MIKVIHVLSDTNIGGAGVLLLNCLRHFDKAKLDVSVVLPSGAALIPAVKELGYKVITTENGKDKSFDKQAIKELKNIFTREKPDIVHTHASFSARIAARMTKVPLVFQTHHCAVEPTKAKTRFPLKQIFGAVNNYLSDRIIATAKVAADILVKQGVKSNKVSLIINGSEPLATISETEKRAIRAFFGFDDDTMIFTSIARLEEVKDHRTLLLATAQAVKAHPEIRVMIVGSGSLEGSLKALAADLEIADKVIFTGFTPDIAPYVNISDVNVNTSLSETSSLAISEGMSLGVPVIASSCPGNAAMVNDGENGLLFDVGSSDMLATAMITLTENMVLRHKMGKKAKEVFAERYNARVMALKLQELYERELLSKKR